MTQPPPGYTERFASGPQPGYQEAGSARSPRPNPLIRLLALLVGLLGLLSIVWGFLSVWTTDSSAGGELLFGGNVFVNLGWSPALLLMGGLIATATLLPGVSKPTAWAVSAAAAIAGGLGALFYLLSPSPYDEDIAEGIDLPSRSAAAGLILLVIAGIIQLILASVACWLASQSRPRPPRPQSPPGGYGAPPGGGFGAPPGGGYGYPPGGGSGYPPDQSARGEYSAGPAGPQQPDNSYQQAPSPQSAPAQFSQPQFRQPQSNQPQFTQPHFGTPQFDSSPSNASPPYSPRSADQQETAAPQPSGQQPPPSSEQSPPPHPGPPEYQPRHGQQPVYDPQSGREVDSGFGDTGPVPSAQSYPVQPSYPPAQMAAAGWSNAPTGPIASGPPPTGQSADGSAQQYARTDYGSSDYVWEPTYSEAPDYEAKAEHEAGAEQPSPPPPEQAFLYETPEWERPQFEPPHLDSGRHTGWDAGYAEETGATETGQQGDPPSGSSPHFRSIPRAE